MSEVKEGRCACGCRGLTAIAKATNERRGTVKGRPLPFVHGHWNVRHGCGRRSGSTAEYRSWLAMVTRCTNERRADYPDYGGRGINFDPSWGNFANFMADMGPRPPGTTLERLDNNLGYCKENCAWKGSLEQARNRRSTKLNYEAVKVIKAMAARGVSRDLLARLHGVHPNNIRKILIGEIWGPTVAPRNRKAAKNAR